MRRGQTWYSPTRVRGRTSTRQHIKPVRCTEGNRVLLFVCHEFTPFAQMLKERTEMGKDWLLTVFVVVAAVLLCGAETEPTATGPGKGTADVPGAEDGPEAVGRTDDAKQSGSAGQIASWQLYVKVFEQNRAVQLDAVRTMQTYGKYEERYRLAEILLKQLFKVLGEAKVNITKWGFLPDDPFPSNQTIREGVSKALENTAMFGEMALRLPDIIHRIYDRQREWQELIRWGVWFCNQSQVFRLSQPSATLLNLMSQELGLVERDPTYINPFTDENLKIQEDEISKRLEYKEKKKAEKKKKKEKKRGPRLSGGNRVEL